MNAIGYINQSEYEPRLLTPDQGYCKENSMWNLSGHMHRAYAEPYFLNFGDVQYFAV